MKKYFSILALIMGFVSVSAFAYDENAQINSLKDSQTVSAGATGGPIVTPQEQAAIDQRQGLQNQNQNGVGNTPNDGNSWRGNNNGQGNFGAGGGRFGR